MPAFFGWHILARYSINHALGAVIRRRRKNLKLSQEDLAAASGYHRSHVSLVENGDVSISIDALSCVAIALGCSMADLLASAEQELDRHRRGEL